MMKIIVTQVLLLPDHAVVSVNFVDRPTSLPSYNMQFALTREEAVAFEPGKTYVLSSVPEPPLEIAKVDAEAVRS